MITMRTLLATTMLLAISTSSACTLDSGRQGVCSGDEDGQIYYVQVLNFVAAKVKVFVDGREIGQVAGYDAGTHVPGFRDLGNMPQCSNALISFGNANLTYLNTLEWTQEALLESPDGCKVQVALLENEEEYPADWEDNGKRLPVSYAEVPARVDCPWTMFFRINGEDPLGTPTPSVSAIPSFDP